MMKIWILSSEVASAQVGGIARYVDNFARILGGAGHEVLVICQGAEDRTRQVAKGYRELTFRCRHDRLSEAWPGGDPVEHPAYPFQVMDYRSALSHQYAEVVRELVREQGEPDVIECQEYNAIGYFVMQDKLVRRGYLERTPLIAHLHTPDFLTSKWNRDSRYCLPGYWIGRMEQAFIVGADARLCPSRYLVPVLREELGESDLSVESIPLPAGEYPEPTGDQSVAERELCYFGRIEPRKGVAEFLGACENLWRDGERFTVRLIGGPVHFHPKGEPFSETIEKRFRQRFGSGEIIHERALPHDEVLRRVSGAGAVVIPSLIENFPNTCLEAMALGKVVVASRQGGQSEMIGENDSYGLLFDWKRDGECEAAILRALRMGSDERVRIGEAARTRIRELCDPERILRRRLEHFAAVRAILEPRRTYPFLNPEIRRGPEGAAAVVGPGQERPRVSAVVPFYNLGAYVLETIDSLLASTAPPDEILIVDDGSTAKASREVLDDLESRDLPGLRILRKPNEGLSLTRNYGAEQASGEYLLFVDADDCVEPEFLEKACYLLDCYENVHYAYAWARFFDGNAGLWVSWSTDLPYLLAHNLLIPVCLVRRSSFLEYGRNKRKIEYGLEDYEAWIGMAEAGCGGVSIPEPLVRYRVREKSMYQVMNKPQMLYLFDLISAEHPRLYERYGRELFNLQNANGPAFMWNMPCSWQTPIDEAFQRAYTEADAMRAERDAIWHEKEAFHEQLMRYRERYGEL